MSQTRSNWHYRNPAVRQVQLARKRVCSITTALANETDTLLFYSPTCAKNSGQGRYLKSNFMSTWRMWLSSHEFNWSINSIARS